MTMPRMRDNDRDTLADHGRQLADLQHDVGEIKETLRDHGERLQRIEDAQREHGAQLANLAHGQRTLHAGMQAILRHLDIDPGSLT